MVIIIIISAGTDSTYIFIDKSVLTDNNISV